MSFIKKDFGIPFTLDESRLYVIKFIRIKSILFR